MKRLSVSAVWLVATAAVSMAPTAVARGGHALRPIVDSDPISEASLRAAQYWRVMPCAGQVTIVAGLAAEAPASGANDGEAIRPAAMWASWSTPWGANLFDVPGVTPAQAIEPARFSNCVVHVDLAVWPDWHRTTRGLSPSARRSFTSTGTWPVIRTSVPHAGRSSTNSPIWHRWPLANAIGWSTGTRPSRRRLRRASGVATTVIVTLDNARYVNLKAMAPRGRVYGY